MIVRFCLVLLGLLYLSFTSYAQQPLPFSTNQQFITRWNGEQYVPFRVKGVNMGVAMPGTFPGELKVDRQQYVDWFVQIKAAGFNCIRLYTLHYPQFYAALDSFNRSQPNNPLYFMQGIWLEEEIPNYDEDLLMLEPFFRQEIEENLGAVHGAVSIPQRLGKAWGLYTVDASPWLMAWIIGREIHPTEVLHTNASHPTMTSYTGQYFQIANSRASESWLVSQLDYLVNRQQLVYGTQRPVSCSSWPSLDPIAHPEEPNRYEDTASFDLSGIDYSQAKAGFFISYHAYPYYPDFISQDPAYQGVSDYLGQNSYLAYLIDLKNHYQGIPLIIAEYGLPSSWGIAHYAQSGMHHGGPDEKEQGEMNIRLLQNIFSAGCGGGISFAWIDEWFKRTWLLDPIDYLTERRILWHNLLSAEQNFGLLGYRLPQQNKSLLQDFGLNAAINKLSALADFGLLQLEIGLNQTFRSSDTLWLAIDTYSDSLGERLLPTADSLHHGAEFLLRITNQRADLYVTEAYDIYGIWHRVSASEQQYRSTASMGKPWKEVRLRNNNGPQEIQYVGRLQANRHDLPPSSKDGVIFYPDKIAVRIPWSLLNIVDPSQFRVFHDDRNTPLAEDTLSDGLRLSVVYRDSLYNVSNRWKWPAWNHALDAVSYEKDSYKIMQQRLPGIAGTLVATRDTLLAEMNTRLQLNALQGLLNNDLLLEPGQTLARLTQAPVHGKVYLQADGSLQYEGAYDFSGIDSFQYALVNGIHQSVATTVYVVVKASNNRIGFVQLYPNPAHQTTVVRAAVPIEKANLYNSTGALLLSLTPNTSSFILEASQWPAGIYTLQLQAGDAISYRKWVVVKP
jgi:hypothetical protein